MNNWLSSSWRKRHALEKEQVQTLLFIEDQRCKFEEMLQRPQHAENDSLMIRVRVRFTEIETAAKAATHIDKLYDLKEEAQRQARCRAYFCPVLEIENEGNMVIYVIEGWGISSADIKKLDGLVGKKLKHAKDDPDDARSALHMIFEEENDWEDYCNDYENTLEKQTYWLFGAIVVFSLLAVVMLRLGSWYSPFPLLCCLLFSGAAGSSASVIAKMPTLDASLKGELDAYSRRVWSRIGIGMVASVIGCAALGWLTVSVRSETFADAVNACANGSCGGMQQLLLFAVPMVLGFSERTLTSFEPTFLGAASDTRKSLPTRRNRNAP